MPTDDPLEQLEQEILAELTQLQLAFRDVSGLPARIVTLFHRYTAAVADALAGEALED